MLLWEDMKKNKNMKSTDLLHTPYIFFLKLAERR
jgi:hypothetical protein